ncbi:MAG: laminin G domain-containing protein [Sedimentisphaerales bacterium]|nr:laminin G domain-containing protein [Sedimentisphaerales bacterium]
MKKQGMILLVLVVVSLWVSIPIQAGTFSYSPWTSDADSGISAGKTYTHAVKFRAADGIPFYAGNGVWFEGDYDNLGTNWRFWNLPSTYDGGTSNVTGAGANLLVSFHYGDDDNFIIRPQLVLSELTPGTEYVATFYAKGWEDSGRLIDVSADDPGDPNDTTIQIDQDLYGGGNGLLLKYQYIAPASGEITFTFKQTQTNLSWHHYAFSNEVYLPVYVDPVPYPGQFVDLSVDLSFEAIPAEGVELTSPVYDLYWGTDPNILTPVLGLTEGSYSLTGLTESTEYYWQVDVFDNEQLIFSTDPNNSKKTWKFTTKTYAPAEKALEYTMDETSGTVVPESIGGYDATAINLDDPNEGGTAWSEGIIGNCLNLDGIDSYVDMGDTAPLPFGGGQAFSISAYFKTTDTEGPIIAYRNSTDDGDKIVCLTVGFDGADSNPGKLRYISRYGGVLYRMTGPDVSDGGWNHVVLSRAEDGTVSMYFNGQFAGSLNDGLAPFDFDLRSLGADLLWIDAGLGGETRRFLAGSVDNVTIWEGALKQSQIDEMVDVIPYRLNPKPVDGATADTDLTLSWGVPFDRYADVTYNVYLGMSPDLTNSLDGATGLTETQFEPTEPLDYETQYYWKVETVVDNQVVYTSPTWSFVTVAGTVGRFSVQPWTGDGDSGIGTNKTYTHSGKFNTGGTDGADFYAGNGVYFEGDTNRAGNGWTLSGTTGVFGTGNLVNVSGDSANLVRAFFYGDTDDVHPVLTLTGLEIGTQYVTTFYIVGFGGAGGRFVDITASDNASSPWRVDQNGAGNGNGQLVKYKFTATTDTISFTFDALSTVDSWHQYAFSNEIAIPFELTPTPAPRDHVGTDVELSWIPDPLGAAQGVTWNLLLGTDPDMATNLIDVEGLTEARYPASGLDPETQYYWTVSAVRNEQVIVTGPVWTFFTRSVEPASVLVEWTMDDAWGDKVTETYAGLDGTLVNFDDPNTAWVAGILNTGLELDGFDDYVDLGDISALSAPEGFAFSISGYFKTTDPEGPIFALRPPAILCVYVGFDGADTQPGYFRFISQTYGVNRRITGPRVDDGLWHHFAVTRSKFGLIELYIDGMFAGSTEDFGGAYGPYGPNAGAFGTDQVWISDPVWSAPYTPEQLHLDGQIDEFTIWQGTLQPDQIATLADLLPTAGDVDGDGDVDMDDLLIVAGSWLTNELPADINQSGTVDYEDFGQVAEDWKK